MDPIARAAAGLLKYGNRNANRLTIAMTPR
jgi:hypothetical protein